MVAQRWHDGLMVHRSSNRSCTRGMIHLIIPGCLQPSIALLVQNRGLKHQSFIPVVRIKIQARWTCFTFAVRQAYLITIHQYFSIEDCILCFRSQKWETAIQHKRLASSVSFQEKGPGHRYGFLTLILVAGLGIVVGFGKGWLGWGQVVVSWLRVTDGGS